MLGSSQQSPPTRPLSPRRLSLPSAPHTSLVLVDSSDSGRSRTKARCLPSPPPNIYARPLPSRSRPLGAKWAQPPRPSSRVSRRAPTDIPSSVSRRAPTDILSRGVPAPSLRAPAPSSSSQGSSPARTTAPPRPRPSAASVHVPSPLKPQFGSPPPPSPRLHAPIAAPSALPRPTLLTLPLPPLWLRPPPLPTRPSLLAPPSHTPPPPPFLSQSLSASPPRFVHVANTPQAPPPCGRPAHGTARGVWTGSRLVQALSSLCACDVELSRLPGSGLHRQTKLYWRGNVVSVNIWQTGRVHVQGFGAGDLARRLSSLSRDSRSQTAHAGSDTPGVGYHPLPETFCFLHSFIRWFRVFCFLVWHVLVFMLLRLRSFLGHPSRSKRRRRHKQIKGVGSQAAARRGARSRCIAIATLVQGRNQTFLSEFQASFSTSPWRNRLHPRCWFAAALSWATYVCGDLSSDALVATWLLLLTLSLVVPGQPHLLASRGGCVCVCVVALVFYSFPFFLVFFCGVLSALCLRDCEALWSALRIPVPTTQAAVRSCINQDGKASRIALDEGFQFLYNSFLGVTSLISLQRRTTGVINVFQSPVSSVPLLASRSWCLLASFFLFLALAAHGLSLVGRVVGFGTVGSVVVLLSLISNGVVSEFLHSFLHNGPATWSSIYTSPMADRLRRCPGGGGLTPASCTPCDYRSFTVCRFHEPGFPGSLPVPPARPSRFCSPAFSRDLSRPPPASPARHRRRSRSPAHSSPVQVLDQSTGPSSSRLFCPVAACPDHAPPSCG